MKRLIFAFMIFISVPSYSEDIFESSNNIEEISDDVFQTTQSSFKVKNRAKIIILNKITSNSKEFDLKSSSIVNFGRAELELNKCINSDNVNNSYLNVTLKENDFENRKRTIFQGWLSSKNPSLSAVEHPVYQIIAISCLS